jgi:hypothetical protein
MNFFDMHPEVSNLRAEEEPGLASFTRRLIEIAAAAEARGSDTSPAAALNVMRLPAIALDQHGFVAEVNAAAEAVFDNEVKIKDRRLFVRDPAARALLKEVIDQLRTSSRLNPLATDPIIVQRRDKMPVIVRIWPFDGAAHLPAQEVRALLTLNALGPKPGPPAAILARGIMHLTYPNSDPHIVAASPVDSGEAGAPADNIKVTDEMIDAGLLAYDEWDFDAVKVALSFLFIVQWLRWHLLRSIPRTLFWIILK